MRTTKAYTDPTLKLLRSISKERRIIDILCLTAIVVLLAIPIFAYLILR